MPPAASDQRAEAPLPFAPSTDGLHVRLRVTPRARRVGIGGVVAEADGEVCLKVSVSAAAENGRANAAVLALLAKEWGLPRSSLSVKAGNADRRKIIGVVGDPDELMQALLVWLNSLKPARKQG
jgi:uncharacterized protein YggU (UPF0235/DUF167 family)